MNIPRILPDGALLGLGSVASAQTPPQPPLICHSVTGAVCTDLTTTMAARKRPASPDARVPSYTEGGTYIPRRTKAQMENLVESRHHLEYIGYRPKEWNGNADSQYFKHPEEIYADLVYRLLPLLAKERVDALLLEDYKKWCKRVWPDNGTPLWPGGTKWDDRFSRAGMGVLYGQSFESQIDNQDDRFGSLAKSPIKKTDGSLIHDRSRVRVRNGVGHSVGSLATSAESYEPKQEFNPAIPLNGAKKLKLKARIAFQTDDQGAVPGDVNFNMEVRLNNNSTALGGVVNVVGALINKKFLSYEQTIDVTGNPTSINRVKLIWTRTGSAARGNFLIDNIQVVKVDVSPNSNLSSPNNLSVTFAEKPGGKDSRIRVQSNYSGNADLAGFNVYRRRIGIESWGEPINIGLVDNPYNRFEDYAFERGTSYQYGVQAVNKNNREMLQIPFVSITVPISSP